MKSINNLKTEISDWERELLKWIGDLDEVRSDKALPLDLRRERKRNIELDWEERPWPRNYVREDDVLTRKIQTKRRTERAFIDTRNDKIRIIQRQYDFFDHLVQMLSELKPQTCLF